MLALLDVGLPGISGYEVCRALKEEFGETMPVILDSGSRTKPHDRAAGLLIGADDYMTKPFDTGELLARMRRSSSGRRSSRRARTDQPAGTRSASARASWRS